MALVLLRKIVKHLSFLSLPPPCHCEVLGVVPPGSVWIFLTLDISRHKQCDCCFACKFCLDFGMSRTVNPHKYLKMDIKQWLTVDPHAPWLAPGDWAIIVHYDLYEILQFAVFLKKKLDLWMCLPAAHSQQGPSKLSGRSASQRCQYSLKTFPTPWFASALSVGILAILTPLIGPLKTYTIPVCYLLSFVAW